MNERELWQYLKTNFPRENEKCEWKSYSNLAHNVSGRKADDVISYVSAIANMQGGHLVMGIEDKTLAILGIQNFHDYTVDNFPFRIMGNCTYLGSEGLHVQSFTTLDTNKTIWILHIPKHLPRKPVLAHKTAWQRKGDSLIALTREREDVILNESIFKSDDWSAVICDGATINDLDPLAIETARHNYKSKFPEYAEDVDSWNDNTFLNKAKITIKGKITRTAIVLLGKAEAEHYILPSEVKIRWILKSVDNEEKDYAIFTCPLLLAVDKVYQKIRNLRYRYLRDQSLFPEEIDQYEPYILREALNNCIAHQDYTAAGRINIVEKEDELIFTNLGTFIPGKVENVIRDDSPEELYRNPFLATAMFNLQMVDTIGSGIRRMFTFQRKRLFPMPEYDFSNGKVKLTITGKVLDMNYAQVLTQNPDLSLMEIVMLDKVQKGKILAREELKWLKAKGLVEGKKPHIHISALLAQKIGQKARYSRHKAFDKEVYFEWILKALKEHTSLSRKDINELLWDKLSDLYNDKQRKNKITNLLTELRTKEKITNLGTDANPKWILTPSTDENEPLLNLKLADTLKEI